MAQILDGRIVRDQIAQELKNEISRLRSKCKLAIIQVGDLAQSNTYIRQKVLFGEKIGAVVQHKSFDADISQRVLIDELLPMNYEPSIHGIIIQQPLPNHLDKDKIIDAIDPVKDVDGQTSVNIKLLFEGPQRNVILGIRQMPETPESNYGKDSGQALRLRSGQARMTNFQGFVPATTKGILSLLDYYKIPISGKHAVIIGRSSLVGKPTALAFLNRDATVTICHSKTQNLTKITKSADILIVAAGKPKLITKDHVTKNQIVIDVGINVIEQSDVSTQQLTISNKRLANKPETEPPAKKLVGDVDFDAVSKIVAAITPVPGGVGPMTVASLFQNLLEAYRHQV